MKARTDVPSEDFTEAVERVVVALLPGEIMTYGEVAAEAGFDGAARAVGQVLARGDDLPWWRVVNASGRLVPGNETEHLRRLQAEGIDVDAGRVRMVKRHPR
jgi:methylated-DNA-protein-cysteine methyltransferase-like protein